MFYQHLHLPSIALLLGASGAVATSALGQTIRVRSADGRAELSLPPGAIPSGADVRIIPMRDSIEPSAVVGAYYRIVPADIRFSQPASLTISVDTTGLPSGVPLASLGIARAADSSWTLLPSIVDDTARTVTAMVDGAASLSVRWHSPAKPCVGGPYRALDFRLGTWDYRAAGYDPGQTVILADPAGCALFERYQDVTGGRSSAFFVYDDRDMKWHSTTVDPGGRAVATGGPEGPRFAMYHSLIDREVYTREPNGEIAFVGERSANGGRTWTSWFNARYTPRHPGQDAPH